MEFSVAGIENFNGRVLFGISRSPLRDLSCCFPEFRGCRGVVIRGYGIDICYYVWGAIFGGCKIGRFDLWSSGVGGDYVMIEIAVMNFRRSFSMRGICWNRWWLKFDMIDVVVYDCFLIQWWIMSDMEVFLNIFLTFHSLSGKNVWWINTNWR